MMLGAGLFQVPAIRTAVDLGYRVITVDYLPDNIGHRYSHDYVNASTRDVAAVLKAAHEHHVDGVFTMASDVALPAVAAIATELGLRGPSVDVVDTLTQKNRFRKFQGMAGVRTPCFIEVTSLRQALEEWDNGPALIKPAASSGSRGIARLDMPAGEIQLLFDTALQFSYNGKVCIEEYISGVDVSVEGFIHDGAVDEAYTTLKQMREFAVLGHTMPSGIAKATELEIRRQVQCVASAIGYHDGPFDADFRLAEDGPLMLEMTPRLGGNAMPILVERACGSPLIERSLRWAMNDALNSTHRSPGKSIESCAAVLMYSARQGVVKSVAAEEMIWRRLPGVMDLCLALETGSRVERFEHGGHVFGYCVLNTPTDTDFAAMAGQVIDALELEVS